MSKSILIVVAHTDDETIGMGGTIARHVQCGHTVYALSMTDGVGARGVAASSEGQRKSAAQKAAEILGFAWLEAGDFPDNAMDSIPLLNVVKVVEAAKRRVNPSIIYTHSSADLNVDHQIVCRATLTAFRPQPSESWEEIRCFEVASATDYGHHDVTDAFHPNLHVEISDYWKVKLAALKAYDSEMRIAPHSRSYEALENLARLRGNQVGLSYAEAFQILRKIERI